MGQAASRQEAFWEACGFGHVERVRRFIAEGIDVNWVSYTHNSCAIHVASQGKPEIVQMLLDSKCNVNVKDDRGNLALHHAAMKGHADIMQTLLDAGSEIDTQEKNGWTPLINAAYWCQPEAAKVLINNKCDVHLQNKDDRTALHEACRSQSDDQSGLAEIVQMLIQSGCDINSKSSDIGEADFTPLMFCGYHGHTEVAEALIQADCDINAQGSNGWTALHWAADRGHCDLVKILLAAGVDPLLEGRRGELALNRTDNNEIRDVLSKAVEEEKAKRNMEKTDEEKHDEESVEEIKAVAKRLSMGTIKPVVKEEQESAADAKPDKDDKDKCSADSVKSDSVSSLSSGTAESNGIPSQDKNRDTEAVGDGNYAATAAATNETKVAESVDSNIDDKTMEEAMSSPKGVSGDNSIKEKETVLPESGDSTFRDVETGESSKAEEERVEDKGDLSVEAVTSGDTLEEDTHSKDEDVAQSENQNVTSPAGDSLVDKSEHDLQTSDLPEENTKKSMNVKTETDISNSNKSIGEKSETDNVIENKPAGCVNMETAHNEDFEDNDGGYLDDFNEDMQKESELATGEK